MGASNGFSPLGETGKGVGNNRCVIGKILSADQQSPERLIFILYSRIQEYSISMDKYLKII
jgi:hypothetical protein